jgi:threonine dehydrogenase-like Zn-dependent dehydrogenase
MQFARLAGGDVIVMDIDAGRLSFAREKLGMTQTLQAGQENTRERLSELTDGDFPTVIFDCTGNPQSMMDGFLNLAHGGRYVLVSLVLADISFPDPEFHKRETTLLSSRNATKVDFEWVIESLESGKVIVDPLLTHHCHFDQMLDQFENWGKPETGVIKAVVEM